jgi:prophage tail gpP-like protein
VSVDVPGGQFRGYTLSSIAERILQPLGVRFSLINPPSGADLPFRNVIVAPGESIGNMLMRLAHQRGCWLWTDVNGDILAGNPPGSGTAVLEEGRNILSAASYVENPAAEFVYSRAQTFGSDHLWGRDAAEISSKAEIAGANAAKGKKIITLAEEPGTQRDTQLRANFEVQAIDSNLRRDTITHRGWFRPGSGTLWKEGDYCTVKSPMLYPHNDGVSNLRVWNVSCSQSDEAGTTTTVELVNDAAYSQQHPDGTKASPYDRSASLAVSEDYA